MAEEVALTMQKEQEILPIVRKVLFGITQKEQELLIELTENLQMIIKPICLFWKIIFVHTSLVGINQ